RHALIERAVAIDHEVSSRFARGVGEYLQRARQVDGRVVDDEEADFDGPGVEVGRGGPLGGDGFPGHQSAPELSPPRCQARWIASSATSPNEAMATVRGVTRRESLTGSRPDVSAVCGARISASAWRTVVLSTACGARTNRLTVLSNHSGSSIKTR